MKNITFIYLICLLMTVPVTLAGWTFHNPSPASNEFNAVASDNGADFFMAGEGGYLLEYDGATFNAPFFNTFQRVHDLEVQGSAGIAACERADVLILDAGQWVVNRPATTAWFYGAAISPGGDLWVCGDAGEVHRYTNGAWEEVSSTTSSTLKDIEMISDTRGWAVGLFGTARVWNGTNFQYYSSGTSRFLRSISGFSETSAWAVGDLGTITHWTGSGFQLETGVNNENLYDVEATSEDEAWAVGDNGTVLHRTASGWNLYTHPSLPSDIDFRSITISGGDNMMIVGSSGTVMKFDGSNWAPLKSDALNALTINTLLIDEGTVLLGGERGRIYEYNGDSFLTQMTGINNDVHILRHDLDGNIWAGCHSGVLLQNSGAGWTSVNTGDTEDIRDIDFLPGGDIWTAGGCDDGSCVSWAVLHYNGSSWTKYGESGS